MKLVYFASVRERVGRPEEILEPPPGTDTVGALVDWLRTRDEGYAAAFASPAVRAAVDRVHAKPGTSIAGAREVAFFPPMTGG